MERDATHFDELKARKDAMRERLRAKCGKIVAAVEALPEPKTFLEAERAASSGAQHYEKRAKNAPIVAFGDTFPLHAAVNSCAKGEDEMAEVDEEFGEGASLIPPSAAP